jgi:hypothetical protein
MPRERCCSCTALTALFELRTALKALHAVGNDDQAVSTGCTADFLRILLQFNREKGKVRPAAAPNAAAVQPFFGPCIAGRSAGMYGGGSSATGGSICDVNTGAPGDKSARPQQLSGALTAAAAKAAATKHTGKTNSGFSAPIVRGAAPRPATAVLKTKSSDFDMMWGGVASCYATQLAQQAREKAAAVRSNDGESPPSCFQLSLLFSVRCTSSVVYCFNM